jgi:hypothetical protein
MSNQLDERIRRMMQQVVDESPPPPDLSAGMPLTPVVARRVPNWAFAAAAAVVVLVLLGGTGWLFGGYGTDVIGEPVAFDFASHSLCEWFSPEDIHAIVASTYMELGVPLDPTDQMQQMHDENSDCYWAYPLVSLSLDESRVPSGPFDSHSALNESVQVSYLSDGSYGLAFGVDVILTVEGHSEQLWFGHAASVDDLGVDVPTVNSLGLTIANKMLLQMGWIDGN